MTTRVIIVKEMTPFIKSCIELKERLKQRIRPENIVEISRTKISYNSNNPNSNSPDFGGFKTKLKYEITPVIRKFRHTQF